MRDVADCGDAPEKHHHISLSVRSFDHENLPFNKVQLPVRGLHGHVFSKNDHKKDEADAPEAEDTCESLISQGHPVCTEQYSRFGIPM